MTRKSVENEPSETAMKVAFCRALAAKDERTEIKSPDYLAALFVSEEFKKSLQDSLRKHIIQHLSSTYGYLIARTAFIDYIFKNSLSENIPQIVILGAGSDTRAYRYQELLGKTRIFELDIAPTQKRKIEILNDEKIDIPEQVTLSASILELTNLKMF